MLLPESAVRYLTLPFILTSLFALSGPCIAGDVPMHKHTADELKGVCTKVGGSFSQDAAHYGCGTDCHGAQGTDCIVSCTISDRCASPRSSAADVHERSRRRCRFQSASDADPSRPSARQANLAIGAEGERSTQLRSAACRDSLARR